MAYLLTGIVLFIILHMFPSAVVLRGRVIAMCGEATYKIVFSLLVLTSISLIILGYRYADYVHIYSPLSFGRHITLGLMMLSSLLIVSSIMQGNIRRFIRHPLLLAIFCWGMAHLFSRGDLAGIILFGGYIVFSILVMWSASRRGVELQNYTVSYLWDIASVIVAGLVYVVAILIHTYVANVPVIHL